MGLIVVADCQNEILCGPVSVSVSVWADATFHGPSGLSSEEGYNTTQCLDSSSLFCLHLPVPNRSRTSSWRRARPTRKRRTQPRMLCSCGARWRRLGKEGTTGSGRINDHRSVSTHSPLHWHTYSLTLTLLTGIHDSDSITQTQTNYHPHGI